MAIIESLTADEIIARLADKADLEVVSLALGLKANLESPTFTGTPSVPTQASSANDLTIANTAFVKTALAALVDSSPGTLDTLNELAAALGDDPNFATTVLTAVALKAPLDSPVFTGNPTVPTPAVGDKDLSIANTAFVEERAVRYTAVTASTSTDRTAPLSDAGALILFNANTAKTQRMPDDATANFPIGSWAEYVAMGANDLTIAAAGSAVVNGGDLTAPRYAIVRVVKTAANTWTVGKPLDALPASTNLETQTMTASDKAVTPASLGAAATTSATANRLAKRDANGRMQAVNPSVSSDVAIKGYVDAVSVKEYTSTTVLDGITSTEIGTLILSDFRVLGLPGVPDIIYDEMHVRTTVQWFDTIPYGHIVQELTGIKQGATSSTTWKRSRQYATSSWGAWSSWTEVPLAVPGRMLPPNGGLFGPEAYRQVTLNSNQFETNFRGFVRILVPKLISIDGLYVHVFTPDAAATVGMALWRCDDGVTVYPATRVAQGTLTPSAGGIQGATFTPIFLNPGWYIAAAAASSNATLRMYSIHDNVTFLEGVSGDIPNESRRVQLTSAAGAYNAPAATITDLEGSGADNTIWVGLRRAS